MADLRVCKRCGEDNDCGDCSCDVTIKAATSLALAIRGFVRRVEVDGLRDAVANAIDREVSFEQDARAAWDALNRLAALAKGNADG